MRTLPVILFLAISFLIACNKPAGPTAAPSVSPSASSTGAMTSNAPKTPDVVQQKLQEYAGSGATDCGRFDVHATAEQSKAASDCALQATQNKHAFLVAYDMPGMAVGVAGNAEGKLFSVQSQGTGASAALTSGACPSELRLAASGRVTCFAPGDMGSMGGGHTAIPPGMPNPHAFPKAK